MHYVEIDGAERIKDKTKKYSRWIIFLSFGHPFLTAGTFVGDRFQSRYWHHLVIPSWIYPVTVPIIFVVEYIITANGMVIVVWYLFVWVMYFRTSCAWVGLVR